MTFLTKLKIETVREYLTLSNSSIQHIPLSASINAPASTQNSPKSKWIKTKEKLGNCEDTNRFEKYFVSFEIIVF